MTRQQRNRTTNKPDPGIETTEKLPPWVTTAGEPAVRWRPFAGAGNRGRACRAVRRSFGGVG